MYYLVNMTDNVTISGLAVRIFLKIYYKNNIPAINKSSIYKNMKRVHQCITKVYIPCGYLLSFIYNSNLLFNISFTCNNSSILHKEDNLRTNTSYIGRIQPIKTYLLKH